MEVHGDLAAASRVSVHEFPELATVLELRMTDVCLVMSDAGL